MGIVERGNGTIRKAYRCATPILGTNVIRICDPERRAHGLIEEVLPSHSIQIRRGTLRGLGMWGSVSYPAPALLLSLTLKEASSLQSRRSRQPTEPEGRTRRLLTAAATAAP